MSKPEQPTLRFKWHQILPKESQRIIQLLNIPNDYYKPRHLLGMVGSEAERIIYKRELTAFMHHALGALDPYLAIVDKVVTVNDHLEHRHVSSRVGMTNFPKVRSGFGKRYDVLIFAQAQGTDDDTYSDGLDYFIRGSNEVLEVRERDRIPTLREYLYPVDRFQL